MSKELMGISRTDWSITLIFEPRDIWIGVYWDWKIDYFCNRYFIYFTLIPTIVIRLVFDKYE